jgi:hypothetical protein
METITITLKPAMLRDKLNTLATEYSLPAETLINLAVKRLIDDVETVRDLRTGTVKLK